MAFTAYWQFADDSSNPSAPFPVLYISGSVRRYTVNWGDGTSDTVDFGRDPGSDGVFNGLTGYHRFADGAYSVSISQGGRGRLVQDWAVTIAAHDTGDLHLTGTAKANYVVAGSGNDWVQGGLGADLLIGGHGDDRLIGGPASAFKFDDDMLYGGFGDDVLIGGAGNDYLYGGNGVDRLNGGTGNDHFVFLRARDDEDTSTLGLDPSRDTVLDFTQGGDKLDVSDWSFRSRPVEFIGQDDFSGSGNSHSEVRFFFSQFGNTIVQLDFDGDGSADGTIRLIGHIDLVSNDFVL